MNHLDIRLKGVNCPQDYLRVLGLQGLRPLVLAAAVYFAFATILVVALAPPAYRGWLLLQKAIYTLAALLFARHLGDQDLNVKRFDHYAPLVLLSCLTSGLCTAAAGLVAPFATYSVALIIGVALSEVSWKRAAMEWAAIWACFLLVFYGQPVTTTLEEAGRLLGIQLMAIPAMGLRLRMALRQYQLIQDLRLTLADSEGTRQNLDSVVERRTSELQAAYGEQAKLQEQLLQSQKMESLGRLAGGVAHDLNNLLTVITGSLELIRSTNQDQECLELVDEADEATRRAAEMTGHLLAFSRKEVLQIKSLRLQKVIARGLKLVERLLGEDVVVTTRLEAPDCYVEGDSGRLQQVLINLVVNARDAMPAGGNLTIQLECKQPGEVLLSVADTGCGMDAATAGRAFEPFFTTKPVGQGTGLGLSTVHGIVNMHSGRLWVDSQPGRGTTVFMALPCRRQSESESLSSADRLQVTEETGQLLLVEDDRQVRSLTARVLRLFGYQVQVFDSAAEALHWLERARCDLLITDAVMPGMDGGRLAQEARRLHPDLPVLFISGYTDDRLSTFGIDRGQANFLAKPFTPKQLQGQVTQILKKSVLPVPGPN